MAGDQQETRVLTAEWTYLNQPERLAELNRRFLGLTAIATKQLQRGIEDIAMRAPPAPPGPPPDTLVDASPGPVGPQETAPPLAVAPAALRPAAAIVATKEADAASPRDEVSAGDVAQPAASAAPVRLAKAGPAPTTSSLDALIAQIAEAR
jgi:hypothetical protein